MGPMLAGVLDFVIGVDTHRDTHTAAIVNATTGGVIGHLTIATDTTGYRLLDAFADRHARPVPGYGPLRAPEATAAGWPHSCWNTVNGSSRSTGPPGPPAATAPNPMTWTRSVPPARP